MTEVIRSAPQLGALVREARKRDNLTQHNLATLTGVGQKTISSIENGGDGVKLETVFRLLPVLGLEMQVTQFFNTAMIKGDVF